MERPLIDIPMPLSLSEQLDAMLAGWLDRHDPGGDLRRSDRVATAVLTVTAGAVREIEALCSRRELTVRRRDRGDGRWAVLAVEGAALPVRGLTEITGMYKR